MTRRDFTRAAAVAATAAGYSRILGANDRVRMGYIGLGNRGDQVHDAFLEHGDQVTAAVCDLRDDYMELAIKKSRATPKKYKEYKRLLDDKEIDAVVIATPDHWHAPMFINACNAGKDVYVEKPLSLTVAEGRHMVETADRTKRVVQVGTNRRSWKTYREMIDYVHAGGIGKISAAKCFSIRNEWPNGLGMPTEGAPPDEWAWDHWLGPAPKVPYNSNRNFYNFRWFYNYSGGQLTNFGVHYMDIIRWAMGKDSPHAVVAIGGKFGGIKDNREIPDTLEVTWDYGDSLATFSQYNANGAPGDLRGSEIHLRGTKGTIYIRNSGWEVVPEEVSETITGYDHGQGYGNPLERKARNIKPKEKLIEAKVEKGTGGGDTFAHTRNFLDCVKSRAKCNADILTGHLSTSTTLIGNIAYKTRNMLEWDARAERFTNNSAANKWLSYTYRSEYKEG
ncbi:MAG TPA: Gfo/Idh/MocA family oxidoreductase [Bryobacteraceae bacterium]